MPQQHKDSTKSSEQHRGTPLQLVGEGPGLPAGQAGVRLTQAAIETAFNTAIYKRGIHRMAGRSLNSVLQLRWRHKHKKDVSLNTKLFFLQKIKWPMEQYQYTRADLASLLIFYTKSTAAAKDLGIEYLIEKWHGSPKK